MRSAIYVGEVWHRRNVPRSHELRYRVAMPYVSLDELDAVLGIHPLWSTRAGAPLRWRAEDYLSGSGSGAGSAGALAELVRDRVGGLCGSRPNGPVVVLANWRSFGWSFNPLSLYYCFDSGGEVLEAVLGEVTNTPWGERQSYLFGQRGIVERRMDKEMHVSPFCGMSQEYRVSAPQPGSSLRVQVDVAEAGEVVIETDLRMERRELTRASMTSMLLHHPAMAQRVSMGIYRNAAWLWAKGVPYHRHPPACPAGRSGAGRSRVSA